MRGGVVAVTALALLAPTASASAQARPAAPAAPAEPVETLATGLLSPLSQAVAEDGTVWFSQNYAGRLERIVPGGQPEVVVQAPGDLEVAAVSERDGTVWYSVTGAGHTVGRLHERSADGTDRVVVDLYAHEQRDDPDAAERYGFRGTLPRACAQQLGANPRGSYRGATETHPVASVPAYGAVYVADAAANAVTAVVDGTATTVLAFPAERTTVTAAYAEENDFPACTVGRDYWAEAVPTDVEAGPFGSLYVTTFPGGPGRVDGAPAGTLWRVLPLTGQAVPVAQGLDTPVGVAVDDATGDVYVSELQADRVVRVAAGTTRATPYAEQTFPGDLEWTPDGLLAGADVLSGTSGEAGDPPRGELVVLK